MLTKKPRSKIVNLSVLVTLSFISGCTTFKGEDLTYSSVTLAGTAEPMKYGVYTPPGWQPGERLPLIVLLHGGGGSHYSFERYQANEFLDQEITRGLVPRAIIVTPNGHNGFWENWHDGSYAYRDWVLDSVLPKVREEYQTLPCPQHCHLAGISMGGFGVLRFASYASDRFSSVSAISAPIFNDEQSRDQKGSWLVRLLFPFERIFGEEYNQEYRDTNPYNAWVENPKVNAMRLQLIWGDNDHRSIIGSNQAFHEHLKERGVDHDAFVYRGGHKWKHWIPNFDRVLNFLINPDFEAEDNIGLGSDTF